MTYRSMSLLGCLTVCTLGAPAAGQEVPQLYSLAADPGHRLGAVTGLPDLDGDGVGEVLLGMPTAPPWEEPGVDAKVVVYSGRTGAVHLTVGAGMLFDEVGLQGGQGQASEAFSFGSVVAPMGDADGDGTPDFVVAAPENIEWPAVVGVFSGADGSRISTHTGLHFGDGYGRALAGIPDANDNGSDDLLIGAPVALQGEGLVFLVDGLTGESILELGLDAVADSAAGFGTEFGAAVAVLDDLDEGGVPEVVVGAPGASRVLMFRGEDGSVIGELQSAPASSRFGAALFTDLDVDGDGRRDFVVGAPDAFGGRGAVFIYNDRSSPALFFVVSNRLTFGFGAAVGLAGDLNDDGFDDVLASSPQDTFISKEGPALSNVVGISGANGKILTRMVAPGEGYALGSTLGYLGDMFGGGTDAFVLGAPGDDEGFSSQGSGGGQAIVGFVPATSNQNAYGEPTNALAGRPGGPALLKVPLASDISFGPVVAVPSADGDSVTSELLAAKTSEFQELGENQVGDFPQQAASADFDQDGRDDYATANAGDDTVSVVVSDDGTDSFASLPGLTLSTGFNSEPLALVTGDLDNDTFPDIVVAGEAGLSVFLNVAGSSFVLASTPLATNVTDLVLGDVDGDGNRDIVIVSGSIPGFLGASPSGTAKVLLGGGDGTFTHGDTFASGPPIASVQIGDLDGDGDLDTLLCQHQMLGPLAQSRITAWFNDGSGDFSPAPWPGAISFDATGIVPTFGALADLNRDGLLDAVYTRNENIAAPAGTFADVQPPLQVFILLNGGLDGGVWQGMTGSTLGTAYTGKAVEPILEDVFTDPNEPDEEDPDLILVWWVDELGGQGGVSQETSLIGLLIGDGQGSFYDPAPNQFVLGDQPGDGDGGDVAGLGFDGFGPDGVTDLVFPNLLGNSLKILTGDGEGGVADVFTVPDIDELDPEDLGDGVWSGGPRVARLQHLDADELLDVVVYNDWREAVFGLSQASLTLLLNDGQGGFVKSDYVTLPRAGEALVTDLDGQGAPDAVITLRVGGTQDRIVVLHGEGAGQLGQPAQILDVPTRDLTGGLAVGPLRGQALLSAVSTSTDPGTGEALLLSWTVRDGLLHETPRESPLGVEWEAVESLLLHDLDDDGRNDVLVGTQAGRLIVAHGLGDGHFERVSINPAVAAVGGGQLAMAMLDGDHRMDLVSSKGSGAAQSGVHLLSGLGGGHFAADALAGVQSSGSLGAQRPVLVDFDDDHTTDIVLSHGTSNSISILLSDLSHVQPISPGKAGTGGVTPSLEVQGYTTAGGTLTLSTGQAVGGAQAALLIGTGPLPFQVPAMSRVEAQIPLVFGGEPGAGGDSGEQVIRFRIPSDPSVVGLEVVVQTLVDDPAVTSEPLGIATSPGLLITVVE